jgi:hypothetical protein
MNREVMSRQMFRNGGVVYMAEGGRPEVVETFSAIFNTGDADKILDYFISHERELKRAAASNEKLGIMIDFIENMEARKADETIAETQRLSEMPSTNKIEVAAPGGSAFIEDKRPLKQRERLQPDKDLDTLFKQYPEYFQIPRDNNPNAVINLPDRFNPFEEKANEPPVINLPDRFNPFEEKQKDLVEPLQYYQQGGMAMPAPMPAAPGPEGIASLPNKAAMEAMPTEGVANEASRVGLDPAVVQQMLGEVDSTLGDLENAESYEEVINGIREADAPIEARYKELAGFVGEEDAMRTPESVLTMLQPVIMMAGVDQGIGALASEEMTTPVTGDMAGGIMSTVNMGQEGVPPVNFNLGGAVQYFDPANENRVAGAMPGGRLGQLYGEKKDLYRSIMGGGAQEEEYQKQKDLTEAQMLFDIAQGALAFAGGAGQPGRSPAEQLAAAASPVLGNIGARAGELAKFKQAQTKEARAMDLAALTAAEGALTAEKAADAAEKLARLKKDRKTVTVKGQVIDITDTNNPKVVFGTKDRETVTVDGRVVDITNPEKPDIIFEKPKTKTVTVGSQVVDITDPENPKVIFKGDKTVKTTTLNGQVLDVTDPKNITVLYGQEKVFGGGLLGTLKNILEGEKSADLATRYGDGKTTPTENNMIEGAINQYTNEVRDYDSSTGDVRVYPENRLIQPWVDALRKRSVIKGASMPTNIGQKEQARLNLPAPGGEPAPAPGGEPAPAPGGQPQPRKEGTVPIEGPTYDSLTKEVAALGAMENITGQLPAIKAFGNRFAEFVTGGPFFRDTAKAQNLLNNINTTVTMGLMQAIPGRESEQLRQEIKGVLPPVAAFTQGTEVALDKTEGFISYLNLQIEGLNKLVESPRTEGKVGEIKQNLQILKSYRDVYQNIADQLVAESAPASAKKLRDTQIPIGKFFKGGKLPPVLQQGR